MLSSSPVAGRRSRPRRTSAAAGQVVSAISPRVAEDLFWLGRYAERAEDISRLVAVTDNRWHDVHPGADPAVARVRRRAAATRCSAITAPWPPLPAPTSTRTAS